MVVAIVDALATAPVFVTHMLALLPLLVANVVVVVVIVVVVLREGDSAAEAEEDRQSRKRYGLTCWFHGEFRFVANRVELFH